MTALMKPLSGQLLCGGHDPTHKAALTPERVAFVPEFLWTPTKRKPRMASLGQGVGQLFPSLETLNPKP